MVPSIRNNMELNTDNIKALMQLMQDFRIDRLKLESLELVKTKHETAKEKTNNTSSSIEPIDDEELLFWSSSAPALTQEQIDAMSYTQVPKPDTKQKKSRKSKDQ